MKLMTEEIEKKLLNAGFIPQIENMMEAEVIVKYFSPVGAGTWLIIGGKRNGEDWELFGYAELGYEWEWGSVMLSDLEEFRGPLGLGIERDLYCSEKYVKNFLNQ